MVSKKFLFTLATIIVIGVIALIAVYLSKGYTFSAKEKRFTGTGIISATSIPDGASVYVDGHLSTATNATLSQLSPRTYNIKLVKEGFIPWEKNIEVREGIVSEIKATLFPALPTIYPLTYSGAINPILSPDGGKLAFTVPLTTDQHSRQKGGIWVWTMATQPLSLNRGAEPHQVLISTSTLDFSKATLKWSPDSKQLLVTMNEGGAVVDEASKRNFLISVDSQTSISDLKDSTPQIENTMKLWADDQKVKDDARMELIPNAKIRQIASDSATLKWSLDESKIITGGIKAENTPTPKLVNKNQPLLSGFKVYDLLTNKNYDLPKAKEYFWLPDSRHVILVLEDKIAICEYDGSNISEIFAGKFEDSNVFPWLDSSRLVILTTFNTPTASAPNLFGINLK